MKKTLDFLLLLMLSLSIVSCNKQPSMDERTAEMLEKRYGKVVSVELTRPGTLSKAIKEVTEEKRIPYLRISGPMNGADIDSLKKMGHYILALDLLDATIESGVPYHDYDDEKTISEDNIIGEGMFNYYRLEQIYLPLKTMKIDDNAFSSCYHLETIRIPQNVVSIGRDAFSSCKNLTSLQLPDKLESIGESAFYGCKSLRRLRIPKSVTTFDVGSFCEPSDLYLEWTPEELGKLGELDFDWIWVNDNPPRNLRSHFVFRNPTLHVPVSYVETYKERFPKSIIIADEGKSDEVNQPTFLMGKEHVGPVNIGPIDDIPLLVDGLYDKYERVSEVPEYGSREMETIHFIKDGKTVFKGELKGDEIYAFYVYPDATNVSSVLNVHAGDNVSNLSLFKDIFKWSNLNAETIYCTIGYLSYYVDIKDLKDGYKYKISLSDFKEEAKIKYIKVQ